MEKITAESIAQWVLDNRYSKGEFQTMHASEMYNTIVEKVNEFSTIKSQSDNRELTEKLQKTSMLIESVRNDLIEENPGIYEFDPQCMRLKNESLAINKLIQKHQS